MSLKCYFISEQVAQFTRQAARRRRPSRRSSVDSDDQAAGLVRRLFIASIRVSIFFLSHNFNMNKV